MGSQVNRFILCLESFLWSCLLSFLDLLSWRGDDLELEDIYHLLLLHFSLFNSRHQTCFISRCLSWSWNLFHFLQTWCNNLEFCDCGLSVVDDIIFPLLWCCYSMNFLCYVVSVICIIVFMLYSKWLFLTFIPWKFGVITSGLVKHIRKLLYDWRRWQPIPWNHKRI